MEPTLFSNEEENESYEIEAIVDDRMKNKIRYFLVKWAGFEDEDEMTWEPEEHLESCRDLIDKYYEMKQRAAEIEPDPIPSHLVDAPLQSNTGPPEDEELVEIELTTDSVPSSNPSSPTKNRRTVTSTDTDSASASPKKIREKKRVVTHLQYQKNAFNESSDAGVIPPSDNSDAEPVVKKKKVKQVQKKTSSTKTPTKQKSTKRLSDSKDVYRKIVGVTLNEHTVQFEVVRNDGKVRTLTKQEMQENHKKLYLQFLEQFVSQD